MINKTKKHIFRTAIITAAFSAFIPFTSMSNHVLPVNPVIKIQAATLGENNALSKAESYLQIMPFSKKGLIDQLKFDGFTAKQVKYGAKKAGF